MAHAAITIEGGLFASDLLDRIAAAPDDVPGQKSTDFGIDGTRLSDEIQNAFSDARVHWEGFKRRRERSRESLTTLTRESWVIPLLEILGYELTYQPRAAVVDGNTYAISHRPGDDPDAPPVHIVAADQRLESRGEDGRRSPHALVQEYLNRTDPLWGIVTNGLRLRLLRDTARLARPTFVEFDLEAILEENLYSEFVVFWRLCHRSRLPQGADDAHECLFEQYHQQGIDEGGRVRERLREGIEEALVILGTGFLQHADSEGLREALATGRLDDVGYYRQLLRLIYRLLFLMVAEERRLLLLPDHENRARQDIYTRWYSVARLRDRAEQRTFDDPHGDLWESLKRSFRLFREEDEADQLGLTALNGELFGIGACHDLEQAAIRNDLLLRAVFNLSTFREREGRRGRSKGVRRRVNYAALDVEELGSVYESLLDFHPQVSVERRRFDLVAGSERKTTGSYYTPPALVRELIKSALEPVLEERLKSADTQDAKIAAILDLKICDPAAGSGHFLLAAARRLGRELAIVRSGEAEPTPTDYRAAVRDVIRNCIYAVDINPLAVDLCKVALWIEGHAAGFPLSFLDHRVKRGNSLIGVFDLEVLETGIPDGAYKKLTGDDKEAAVKLRTRNRQERSGQRTLDTLFGPDPAATTAKLAQAAAEIVALEEATPDDVHRKEELYAALHDRGTQWHRLKTACDLWCAAFFADKQPVTGTGQEIVPTTEIAHQARAGRAPPNRMGAMADTLAERHGFFHWPLEFPDVFVAGGFDVMLGNPPWDTLSPDAKEFFSTYDSSVRFLSPSDQQTLIDELLTDTTIRHRWDDYCRALYAGVSFMKNSGRYRLFAPGNLGKGDFNIYRMFVELALDATRTGGFASQIAPENLYNGANAAAIRSTLFERFTLTKLLGFENARHVWFQSVDTRMKFCLYVAQKGGSTEKIPAAFRIKSEPRLQHFDGGTLHIPVALVREFSPDALAVMEFGSQLDINICRKMYDRFPKLGEEIEGLPYRHYMREVDMGNDRELFVEDSSGLPVFEGRMVSIYDYRTKGYVSGRGRAAVWEDMSFGDPRKTIQPQWHIAENRLPAKLQDRVTKYRIGFCDVASPTNERSLVAALIPPNTVCGHKVPTIVFEPDTAELMALWLGVANSMTMDFLVRKKISLAMSYTVMDTLPFPRTIDTDGLMYEVAKRALLLSCSGPEMEEFFTTTAPSLCLDAARNQPVGDAEERDRLRAEIDVLVARNLFGLTRDELRYIVDPSDVFGSDYPDETFGALKRREMRLYGEYRTQRLVLEAWDRFASDGTFDPTRMGAETSIDIPAAGDSDIQRRLAAAEATIAALRSEIGDSRTPTLFVEGATDVQILEAAWTAFYPDEPLPVRIISAGGTTQMGSLAARGKAMRELLDGRVVCALADNDGEGRRLWNDGNLHKGGVWKEQTNGVNWCLLRPTDEFVEVMQAHQIPKACWPFTVESCFLATLRAEAISAGAYGFAPGAQSDLTTNPEVVQRMLQVLPGLADTDPASFYLRPPDPELKHAFAEWVCAPERRTRKTFAAFEIVLERLKALLEGE